MCTNTPAMNTRPYFNRRGFEARKNPVSFITSLLEIIGVLFFFYGNNNYHKYYQQLEN